VALSGAIVWGTEQYCCTGALGALIAQICIADHSMAVDSSTFEQKDGSVSPMARMPRSASPATPTTASNGSASALRKSGLRTEISNNGLEDNLPPPSPIAMPIRRHTDGSNIEARDYMNGGLPHTSASFGFSGVTSPGPLYQKSLPALPRKPVPSSDLTNRPNDTVINGTGASTPPPRRSVQFARQGPDYEPPGHVRQDSWDNEDSEAPNKGKGLSLMSKLMALATSGGLQTHTRSPSGGNAHPEDGSPSAPHSPSADRSGARVPHTLEEEGSDVDADAEETADEGVPPHVSRFRRKRRSHRPQENGSQTAPTTPKSRALFGDSPSVAGSRLPFTLSRRATMPDEIVDSRGGLSEGEGRDRLGKQIAWRRGSSWVGASRGYSFSGAVPGGDGTLVRKPGNFRRAMTGLTGGGSDGEAQMKRPFLSAGRTATFGAHGWKTFKHGFKLLGQRKEEHKIDYLKSAELMAELRAGAPAALMLASMIQRDEHGNKRIPVLLEQLKLEITDSRTLDDKDDETERHLVFRIELEYGSGLNRMKWVINRSLRDFINLHLRYKLQTSSDKYIQLRTDIASRPKQPRFPKSAFPYLRGVRGLGESEDDEADAIRVEDTVGEATHSETERPARRKKRQPSLGYIGRKGSTAGLAPSSGSVGPGGEALAAINAKKAYNERQRRKLEQYLQEMIRWLIFRADSNRLCKFLELSALGVRLAAEGSYHGKEGYLAIHVSKGLDFRRILTPKAIFARHSPKWFLVRHSYIVCVDSPENMHIYDVFLLDPKFTVQTKRKKLKDSAAEDTAKSPKRSAARPQHHRLKLQNSERKITLLAKNERQLRQFEESINHIVKSSQWSKPNRFDSFAPVRTGVYAQWLVDGRDYMWNVSRAINMAKDVIYIHDWWLSPQLYMRRPAAISQKWRLDRLLRKKAREGVKVFIIIYRNVEAAVPIDSEYTKFSMLDLHPNIFVQRSPNQFKKNQFFFAHHEKICIVDHTVAFVGGIDLCFGRWDTPQHSVCDDKPTGFEPSDEPKDADHCQLWPGKDYSNPRVQDFYQLNEPYAEMYDRSKTPRMPWHDISMQVVGQPARDLTRHFVQRWNYVLRGRKPTRPTPFLLPPPDYVPADLEALGLTGTCEVQILRSACNWSLGLEETEHSIMNAYCKMIEESEHFVYMENQFFITSCETMNVKIVNKIGDALVERAVRAYNNGESWRCVIVIPLMPGFQNTVDAPDGTSVRLIMQCQFRSICRGEGSIFGRLRSEGIEPEDYISFYSLRSWGKIGPRKMLVTEQLYIHAKVIIVDDRIALIGSANINERSMLGTRDSECAAVVRDTDMLYSTMDGEPYLVGRFAHTLRMRLMREHLGLDVDEIMEEERSAELDREETEFEAKMNDVYDDGMDADGESPVADHVHLNVQGKSQVERLATQDYLRSFNHDVDWEEGDNPNLKSDKSGVTSDKRVTGNQKHAAEVDGEGRDRWKEAEASGVVRGRDSVVVDGFREVLVTDIAAEGKGTLDNPRKPHERVSSPRSEEVSPGVSNAGLPPRPQFPRQNTEQLGLRQLSQLPALPPLDDTDIGGPPVKKGSSGQAFDPNNPLIADIKLAAIDKDCMKDPLNDSFFEDTWRLVAENNTKIFRRVFRCNPDNEVINWHEYTEFEAYIERFNQAQGNAKSQTRDAEEAKGQSGPPCASSVIPQLGPVGVGLTRLSEKAAAHGHSSGEHPIGTVADWANNAQAENAARDDTTGVQGSIGRPSNLSNEKAALDRDSNDVSSPSLAAGDNPLPDGTHNNNSSVGAENVTEKLGNQRTTTSAVAEKVNTSGTGSAPANQGTVKRRRRATTKSRKGFSASDDLMSREDAELLLSMVRGSLVLFPYDWLKAEEHNSNWLYQVDQVAPLQI
jgi:phospholipase D1/2